MLIKDIFLSKGKIRGSVLISTLILLYSSLFIFGYSSLSDRLVFPAPPASYEDSGEIIKLKIDSGDTISSLYLPVAGSRYTILYNHGNGEDLGEIRPRLEYLRGKGFSVFSYDYPGYGTSSGKSNEAVAYQTAEAAYSYLTNTLNISPDRIILYGRSIGSGMAVELAKRHDGAGLILEGPFVSTFRVMTRFKILPFDKFDNLSKISGLNLPILIIHGERDIVVPFWHGKKLYEAANEPKIFLDIPEAGHNDILDVAGDKYGQAIDAFYKLVVAEKAE
ncbi:MAG: alpha/beta hydrolase [Nitrospinota bacterium]|nr:alpha/beta hydrolase [Nitrospinota bacterium]